MNNHGHDALDRTDEEILTHTGSDEALEAAAHTQIGGITLPSLTSQAPRGNQCC